ncbi:unnamed protein product, partial [Arabidopsis halleri]
MVSADVEQFKKTIITTWDSSIKLLLHGLIICLILTRIQS